MKEHTTQENSVESTQIESTKQDSTLEIKQDSKKVKQKSKQKSKNVEQDSKELHSNKIEQDLAHNTDTEIEHSHTLQDKLKMRFLADKARFITAFILIGILALVLIIDSPLLTCVVLGVLCLVGVQESLSLYKLESAPHYYIFTFFIWVLAYINERVVESAFIVLVMYASFLAYSKKISPKTMLPFIYPIIPFLSIYALYKDAGGAGIWVIVWLIVIVAFTDTGAYFGGKAFGKTPFCETSPKKTIEGVICGVVCGVIFGSIVGIGTCGSFLYSLMITFVVSIASVFGDLFESYLKREAGVKDSGSLLPGHGGVLDRLDAVLFGAVIMHFLLYFLPGYREMAIVL